MRLIPLFFFGFIFMACQSKAQIQVGQTTVDTSTVIGGLDVPWEIVWGPDDHIWFTERYGKVSRLDPSTGNRTEILDLTGVVYQQSESGLLGMALHPNFTQNPQVFLVYTYLQGSNIKERLVRYDYGSGALSNPLTLIENIPGNTTHDGSRLVFLPDGTLLMTTGDAQNQASSQNTSALSGKILRLNTDGSIPSDNPLPGNPVFSWGHRNAQGLLLHPNGNLYSSEHGPQTDDEFNKIEMGRNYGWPNVHGYCDAPNEMQFCTDSNVAEPMMAWTPTLAVSDIALYTHSAIPEWTGKILMTVLKDKELVALELNAAGDSIIGTATYFENMFGRLRDVCMDPSGNIYLATNGQSWNNGSPFTHSIVKVASENFPSGVGENESLAKPYPNPAKAFLELPYTGKYSIEITNALGQLVETKTLVGPQRMSLHSYETGTYFFKVVQGGKAEVFRLVVSS